MYRDGQFGVEPLEQIEEDLNEARKYVPNVTRSISGKMGDPFALSADRLEAIAVMIRMHICPK